MRLAKMSLSIFQVLVLRSCPGSCSIYLILTLITLFGTYEFLRAFNPGHPFQFRDTFPFSALNIRRTGGSLCIRLYAHSYSAHGFSVLSFPIMTLRG